MSTCSCQQHLNVDYKLLKSSETSGICLIAVVHWTVNMWQSDLHQAQDPRITTRISSSPTCSWPWLMQTTSSCTTVYVQEGSPGSRSNGAVFATTKLQKLVQEDKLGLPDLAPLSGHQQAVHISKLVTRLSLWRHGWWSHFLDMTWASTREYIYNCRISRARRVVENALGLLANGYRCLLGTLLQDPERRSEMVLTICTLHNISRTLWCQSEPPNPVGRMANEFSGIRVVINRTQFPVLQVSWNSWFEVPIRIM